MNVQQPGRGDLFYFLRPLPAPLEELRTAFYGCLEPIANRWRGALDIPHRYPDTLDAFLMQNRKAGQVCSDDSKYCSVCPFRVRIRISDRQASAGISSIRPRP